MAETDLSKIVNLIMENPRLIEEIRSIANRSEDTVENSGSPPRSLNEEAEEVISASNIKKDDANTYSASKSHRRSELLRALRPYLSKERGRAIESMITVADILLAVKEN